MLESFHQKRSNVGVISCQYLGEMLSFAKSIEDIEERELFLRFFFISSSHKALDMLKEYDEYNRVFEKGNPRHH